MKYLPDRKMLATGLTGLIIWIASLVAEWYGVAVSSDVLGALIAVISPAVGYIVPPAVKDVAARLDSDLRRVFEIRQAATPGLTPPREILEPMAPEKQDLV